MIIDLMKKRTSVRNFSDKDISDENMNTILEAARFSPSGGNEQQYIFGVISDKMKINEISDIANKQKWIKTCNKIVVLCSKIKSDEKNGRWIQEKRYPNLEISKIDKKLYTSLNIEEHQTKIPGTVMMLQALELGIYSTWVSLFDVDKLKKLLNLPEDIYPSEMLILGYPKDELKYLKKKELSEITFKDEY